MIQDGSVESAWPVPHPPVGRARTAAARPWRKHRATLGLLTQALFPAGHLLVGAFDPTETVLLQEAGKDPVTERVLTIGFPAAKK